MLSVAPVTNSEPGIPIRPAWPWLLLYFPLDKNSPKDKTVYLQETNKLIMWNVFGSQTYENKHKILGVRDIKLVCFPKNKFFLYKLVSQRTEFKSTQIHQQHKWNLVGNLYHTYLSIIAFKVFLLFLLKMSFFDYLKSKDSTIGDRSTPRQFQDFQIGKMNVNGLEKWN